MSISEVKEYFQESLMYDQQYFDDVFEAYHKELYNLYLQLKKNNDEAIIGPLTLPNELYDYLEGNGFLFENGEFGRIIVKKIIPELEVGKGYTAEELQIIIDKLGDNLTVNTYGSDSSTITITSPDCTGTYISTPVSWSGTISTSINDTLNYVGDISTYVGNISSSTTASSCDYSIITGSNVCGSLGAKR